MTVPRRMNGLVAVVALILAAGPAVPAAAGETELSGFLAGDLRVFPRAPAYQEQSGAVLVPSLAVQPELRREWNAGDDRLTIIPFARLDARDSERTHIDLRELNWLHVGEGWDLRLGVDRVFWGVTESRHLVDIVNQTDLVEDLDGEDKLGQPMINLGLERAWGNLNVLVLPGFRERTFVGTKGRLRGTLPVATDRAVYESAAGRQRVDLAVRYTTVIGDWDIGLAQFRGTGREPRLVPGVDGSGAPVLVPHYDVIDQTGLDVQATLGDWLWKLEAIRRTGQGKAFAALVGGFEYTLYGVFDSSADVGLIVEYLYDGRGAGAPSTAYDDDVFVGLRLALNDSRDTEFLVGGVVDRDSFATILSIEAKRRLNDRWTLELEGTSFIGMPASDSLFGIRKDSFLTLRLARYF